MPQIGIAGNTQDSLGAAPTFSDIVCNSIRIGTAADNATINAGVMTYAGTAKRHLSMRPFIEIGKIAQNSKPTIVERGASHGYSLPIWSNDQEEIYISEYIAGRWDGASNIVASIIGYLDTAEDVGDDFRLQFSWCNKEPESGVWPSSVTNVEVGTNIAAGRAAQFSMYKVLFPIDYTIPAPDIAASDFFAARIRRIAVIGGEVEIAGEFVITSVMLQYQVDKVFKA